MNAGSQAAAAPVAQQNAMLNAKMQSANQTDRRGGQDGAYHRDGGGSERAGELPAGSWDMKGKRKKSKGIQALALC
ncbi:hypothetical protein FGB62_303g02 [Gracilaria domingensis]|nr:hypothetical protein FGB62_303g02 [Gracilaria domingensis]